jgi:hypothetical protein
MAPEEQRRRASLLKELADSPTGTVVKEPSIELTMLVIEINTIADIIGAPWAVEYDDETGLLRMHPGMYELLHQHRDVYDMLTAVE